VFANYTSKLDVGKSVPTIVSVNPERLKEVISASEFSMYSNSQDSISHRPSWSFEVTITYEVSTS
jgi:hypothetical protein